MLGSDRTAAFSSLVLASLGPGSSRHLGSMFEMRSKNFWKLIRQPEAHSARRGPDRDNCFATALMAAPCPVMPAGPLMPMGRRWLAPVPSVPVGPPEIWQRPQVVRGSASKLEDKMGILVRL